MVTGIIYKLVCNETGDVYYGSTQQSLKQRIGGHKSGCKAWKAGKNGYTTSFGIIERGNYSYSLIETVECEDKHQLETRERYYIENNECVNKFIPARSHKEYTKSYYEANIDSISEKNKVYRESNKEAKKAYREQNKLQTKTQQMEEIRDKRRQIIEERHAYNEANKEKITEQRKRRAELKRLKENN